MERWEPRHERRGRGRGRGKESESGGGRGRGRGNYSSSWSSSLSSFAQPNESRPSNTSVHDNASSKATRHNSSGINNNQDNNEDKGLPNLVGTCPYMCPVEERIQRERLRDLAIFERLDGNPSKSSPTLAVKKFCRTINIKHVQPVDVRPLLVLEDTLDYLLSIFDSGGHAFEAVHDFLFDRTRSIRQDLSMQNISGDQVVSMYEKIVKFHIVSHHKLRRCSGNLDVSPMYHLNLEQLTKALASLYNLYEAHRESHHSTYESEAEFYSLYVLLHLGSDRQPAGESLSSWFRCLPYSIIKSKEMMFSRRLLRYFRFGDYTRFLHTTEAEASCLQYYVIEPYICDIRAFALSCINYGGYKLSPYPLADLSKQLLFEESDAESFCRDCGLDTYTSDGGIKFLPTKQTSFCYTNKGSQRYYSLDSERLKEL